MTSRLQVDDAFVSQFPVSDQVAISLRYLLHESLAGVPRTWETSAKAFESGSRAAHAMDRL
jgi:hypothetical protein